MIQHIFSTDQLLIDHLRLKLSPNAEILSPGDSSWEQALKSFNKDSENQTPSIYVKCSTEEDVAECIKFARLNNLDLTPRSGCHNLGNFSLLQGGLIIDIKKMNKIGHSIENKTITYQTGCRFGQIDDYVNSNLPGFAYVGAMDPSIGTAGARCALGVGWLQRLLGNGIDNIISARIVLADGSIIVANQTENSDLLFAIRGAGSNFGVVTELTQRVHFILDPQQKEQVLYSAHFYPIDKAQQIYEKVRQISFRVDFPDEAFMLPVLHFVEGKRGLSIFFCHYKYNTSMKCIVTEQHWTEKDLKTICAQYNGIPINHLGKQDGWGYISHATLQKKAMNIPWGSSFYPCGGFVTAENAKAVTDALIQHWRVSDIPEFSKDVPFHSTSFYHFGGTAQKIRNRLNTAWPGNEKTALLTVTWGGWKTEESKNKMIRWVKEQWRPILPNLQFGYLCAAAFDWNKISFAKFVYGDNFQKLSTIKAKYDPQNIFRHNVNIPPKNI